ncbi:MAG TPA: glycosyltransferase family 2 protein [Candidatus Polarisedimenticolia bacterium]|nr:glycosyltransferase family 2 protein [Candidatus Polarisedimenticolia bacterium]
MSQSLTCVALLLTAAWTAFGVLFLRGARQLRHLDEELDRESQGPVPATGTGAVPSLAVVVTARNEAGAIEGTVRSLMRQRHPALHVVVVDDRSTDATPSVLSRLAAEADARLEVVRIEVLPDGWLGKCHACHAGARRARGDWILFMDGDVTLAREDLLERTVALAARRGIDHLPILPDMRPTGLMQGALLANFEQGLLLHGRFWEMDRDRPRGGSGVGAFNLVRRAAYDRVGGHTLLKMEVAEDYKLGMLLKESGARQRLWSGLGVVACPWLRGVAEMMRGLEKNFFGGVGYSLWTVAWQTSLAAILQIGPLLLALFGGSLWLALPWLVQQGFLVAILRSESDRLGHPAPALWLAYPLAVPLILFAYWNSALKTLAQGGIHWRDTFYPLAALKAGAVRPGDWRRRGGRGPVALSEDRL